MVRRPAVLLCAAMLVPVVQASAQVLKLDNLAVRVDSSRKEVVLTAGPFNLPSMGGHLGHAGHEEGSMPKYVDKFSWPLQATGRGFVLELKDQNGKKVTQKVLHHMQIVNSDRRQLLLPMDEKLMAVGRETKNIMLPNTIGLPLTAGSAMKLDVMWHNETKVSYDSVYMTLRIKYNPANLVPAPVEVLPISIDIADAKGRPNTFPIPPGDFIVTRDFVMPVDGRILGFSGHMHNYGTGMWLEDVESGKVITRIMPDLDSTGAIEHMPVKLYGIYGEGLKVRANRRYRMVATYHNPTDHEISGAMAHINGLIHPTDMRQWPAKGGTLMAYQDDGAYEMIEEKTAAAGDGHNHSH
jgi:hypothetical protein